MKKIVIFSVSDTHFVGSQYAALSNGFRKLGFQVINIYINQEDHIRKFLDAINTYDDIVCSIGHNAFGIDLLNNGKPLHQSIVFPHVAILDDAPYNKITSGFNNCTCNNLVVAVRDRSHLPYIESPEYSNVRYSFFLPFGCIMDDIKREEKDKSNDIVFSSAYYGEAQKGWRDLQLSAYVRSILDACADYLEDNAVTIREGLEYVTNIKGMTTAEVMPLFFPFYPLMYEYTKTYRRNRLIQYLTEAGHEIVVCSDSWKRSPFSGKLCFQNAPTTDSILELYRRTKILIQDIAEFNNGTHCRVADGILCGAAIISESSRYLREVFDRNEAVYLFNWKSLTNVSKQIGKLLDDEALRVKQVQNTKQKILDMFMPEHSAKMILDAVAQASV